MDKKTFIVYVALSIVLIAVYLYVTYTSEKRAQQLHDLEIMSMRENAMLSKKLQRETSEAAIDTLKSIPDAISQIKITQVVEKKPLFNISFFKNKKGPLSA